MKRRLIIPEVVQSSMMDCGPASLKAMLEGWGIPVSYGRLREACQTDVDGTSIDTLEDVGAQLGLITEQIMVPIDHVLLSSANTFPAIVVVMHPSGVTHFVIAWRKHGQFVQLMDPAIGRRWVSCHRFLDELYVHRLAVPATDWREWAGSTEFLSPLRERLGQLRIPSATQNRLIEEATSDHTWRGLAALDATTRLLAAIVRARAINSGAQAARMLEAFTHNAQHDDQNENALTIPSSYWSVRPIASDSEEEQLLLRGAVLVRVKGVRAVAESVDDQTEQPRLSPELVAALSERRSRPMRELFHLFRADGVLIPLALLFALLLAAGGVIFESLLFRRFLEIGNELVLSRQRLGGVGFLLLFLFALLLLDLPIVAAAWNLGRRLEMRLRIAFLEKLPRLSDRYFHSRLTSDMAERAQSIHRLRMLPEIGSHLVRAAFTLVVTLVAIVWLSPSSRSLAMVAAVLIVAIPVLGNLFLSEYDLRARTHAGALSRYYLGALLGLVPIRTHSAERAVRLEHEGLLVEWTRAARSVQKGVVMVEALQLFAGFGMAALLSYNYVMNESQIGAAVLMIFWGLSLPVIGQDIATLTRFYPAFRNITLRLLEPMGAIEEESNTDTTLQSNCPTQTNVGVSIHLRDVDVVAAGHTILEGINLTVEPGAQVAIVGSSGAGKSSLFGLLLGWHRASQGQVLVDDCALEGRQLEELRRHTAWVDPAIQLWNRSLLENLRYGANGNSMTSIGNVIDSADLSRTLQQLPDGLQAALGEGGTLLSGGEGQRVRLGRAMLRPKIRLVLLDESFRGLDRESRHTLLTHARRAWPEATLLCITHDIAATRSFERVLVVDAGKIIEDGAPAELLRQAVSRYKDLLQAEESVRRGLWSGVVWRRMQFKKGHLYEVNGLCTESTEEISRAKAQRRKALSRF